METKICFKCGQEKPLSEFYRHPRMADGHLNKCKECAKKDVSQNYEKNIQSEEYVEKERERCRDKYRRLYAGRLEKTHSHMENSSTRRELTQKGVVIERGMEVHHWNYNKRLSVFILTAREHKKVHRGLVFDEGSGCFKNGEILLDTAERHRQYIADTIGRNDFIFIEK